MEYSDFVISHLILEICATMGTITKILILESYKYSCNMSFLVCTRANPSQLKQLHFMPYFLSTLFKSFLNDVLFKAEIICSSVYHILFL